MNCIVIEGYPDRKHIKKFRPSRWTRFVRDGFFLSRFDRFINWYNLQKNIIDRKREYKIFVALGLKEFHLPDSLGIRKDLR
jgi:hypothetical protein